MSEVHACVLRKDMLEHASSNLCDGKGYWNEETLTCRECAPYSGEDTFVFKPDQVILKHHGETDSELVLYVNKKGIAKIATPYGKMFCETVLLQYHRRENQIAVEYQILQETVVLSHILLEIKLRFLD